MSPLTPWQVFKLRVAMGETKFTADAVQWYKLGSIWVFGAICAAPSIYNEIASMGFLDQVPHQFTITLRILAGLGVAVRILRQPRKDG
jgi:hypothetical protein